MKPRTIPWEPRSSTARVHLYSRRRESAASSASRCACPAYATSMPPGLRTAAERSASAPQRSIRARPYGGSVATMSNEPGSSAPPSRARLKSPRRTSSTGTHVAGVDKAPIGLSRPRPPVKRPANMWAR